MQHSVNFIIDVLTRFEIPYSPPSPDNGQNSDSGISNFRNPGQSLIKRNCHNSRTSGDIDMKFSVVTKIDKRNKTTSKKIDDKIVTSLPILQFTDNLEQSGSRIPDT